MINIRVPCRDGTIRNEVVYDCKEYKFHDSYFVEKKRKGRKSKHTYISHPVTFDIEVTTIDNRESGGTPFGFMYVWQMCIHGDVVIGRTWNEWLDFMARMANWYELSDTLLLVCYVHNLAYEFQFMKDFLEWEKVFAKDTRKVLYAVTSTFHVEFRCSYFLSNMSLKKYCENSPSAIHDKQSGKDYDYMKLRLPSTPLTEEELVYCYCDVMGLYECLCDALNEDTLATIPMTNTGYVRRYCRNKVKTNPANRELFLKCKLNKDDYIMLKEALRGGNTHCSRYFVGKILNDVHNYDISSSYPYVMMTKYYPVSGFTKVGDITKTKELNYYCKHFCCLFHAAFENLRIKDDVPIAYIASAKLLRYKNLDVYNGRVLNADIALMTLTEIDFEIIQSQYDWDNMLVSDFKIAIRGELPDEIKQSIMYFYENKCTLKGVDDYLYMKSKNRLNSIFGMACTDIIHDEIEYNQETKEWTKEKADIEESLQSYYKGYNNFMSYQWGVWVTAHARKQLQKIVDVTGMSTIYVDTDSDKTQAPDESKIEKLNNEIRKTCIEKNAYVDYNNKRYYLGTYEKEDDYKSFISLGAKKYAYIDNNDKLHITIAGVNKEDGALELQELGGLSAMRKGTVFIKSAGLDAWYNDCAIHTIKINGEEILTASNIGMLSGSYTLGYTDDVAEFFNQNYLTKYII